MGWEGIAWRGPTTAPAMFSGRQPQSACCWSHPGSLWAEPLEGKPNWSSSPSRNSDLSARRTSYKTDLKQIAGPLWPDIVGLETMEATTSTFLGSKETLFAWFGVPISKTAFIRFVTPAWGGATSLWVIRVPQADNSHFGRHEDSLAHELCNTWIKGCCDTSISYCQRLLSIECFYHDSYHMIGD